MNDATEERTKLCDRVHALVDRLADGSRDDAARDTLIRDLAVWQAEHVAPYRRLVESRGVDPREAPLDAIPALPTDVFRWARVAAHPAERDVRVFRSSGTTDERRSEHPLADTGLYDHAARAAAAHWLFPGVDRIDMAMLAPHEDEAPDSSLSYMLSRFAEWFGAETTWVWQGGALDGERLGELLSQAARRGTPLALLGTSFAFVHAEDALGQRRLALAPKSRIMQTGGFKGRSRTVEPGAMRAMLAARYGVPEPFVVAEYGMTELGSQMYEGTLRAATHGGPTERSLRVPGWVRATVVSPETLAPLPRGEVGILRIDDVANVDGVCCVQTADLARSLEQGVEVLGRAPGSTPRGCSLAADAALSGGGEPQ